MIKWYKTINKINWDRSNKTRREKSRLRVKKNTYTYIIIKQEKLLIIFFQDINFWRANKSGNNFIVNVVIISLKHNFRFI